VLVVRRADMVRTGRQAPHAFADVGGVDRAAELRLNGVLSGQRQRESRKDGDCNKTQELTRVGECGRHEYLRVDFTSWVLEIRGSRFEVGGSKCLKRQARTSEKIKPRRYPRLLRCSTDKTAGGNDASRPAITRHLRVRTERPSTHDPTGGVSLGLVLRRE